MTGKGEYSYLHESGELKVLFSGIVRAISDAAIVMEALDRTQEFAILPETKICRGGLAGSDPGLFVVGSPATVQTAIAAPDKAVLIAEGLLAVSPMGDFGAPAAVTCD